MAGVPASTAAPAEELRLPYFFPRVPKECKDVGRAFFDCLTPASEYKPGMDANVAREALRKCKPEMDVYAACAEKHLTAKQREIVQAPKVYLEKVAAPGST